MLFQNELLEMELSLEQVAEALQLPLSEVSQTQEEQR
jgi:hypothetical protein